jgi:PAS domain S-box-containing protein
MPERFPPDVALYQGALDTAPEAVLWVDGEGRLAYVNERTCSTLGYAREELLGMRIWDVDLTMDRERWAAAWAETLLGSRSETRYRRKDGGAIPVEVSAKDLPVGRERLRVAFVRDMAESRAVTGALRRTQAAVDRAREAIFWIRSDGRFVYVNDAACESLGYTRDELLQLTVPDIDPNVPAAVWERDWQRSREARSFVAETRHRTKSGREFPVEVAITFMQFEGEEYNCVYTRDISDRKRAESERARLESQLLHAQKLESVGRLAGGVAHDFNNMLSVILGYTELVAGQLAPDDPLQEPMAEIRNAASRSRDTTRQLLAFSRRQMIAPRPVDLNDLVENTKNTLLRLVGEDVELRFAAGEGLWRIAFDPAQLEQLLVNLVVNARDALPDGGRIAIETTNVRVDEAYCRDHAEATPGDYVLLTVSDDGVGMDKETLAHVFEPFFSTKEVGRGTGLGLATVYGMVKQNDGFIAVASAPGRGTTFRLHVPRMKSAVGEPRPAPPAPAARRRGTILIVEDDEMVRNLTRSMLGGLGYEVLAAATPKAALSLCADLRNRIDLLVSDVVMPEMKGPELADRIRAARPGLAVLFMSGYTSSVVVRPGGDDEGIDFIQKPFTRAELAQSVERALLGAAHSAGDVPAGGT